MRTLIAWLPVIVVTISSLVVAREFNLSFPGVLCLYFLCKGAIRGWEMENKS